MTIFGIPVIIRDYHDVFLLGECKGNWYINSSYLSCKYQIDAECWTQVGLPNDVLLVYRDVSFALPKDKLYPCNPNVVFASYNDKEGALWYKNEKKLLNHNDPIILEMLKQKDFYALWDYLEDA